MKTNFYSLLLILSLLSCKTVQINNPKFEETFEIPPGTMKISDNFYCDQHELTNFSWKEYVHYNKRVFTEKSEQYEFSLPNQEVWLNDSCFDVHVYADYYFEHPAYRDYPLIGITKEQAEAYCKWRSDRVFEFLLIRAELREAATIKTKAEPFTIEDYFRGTQGNATLDAEIKYYPHYRLMSPEEWRELVMIGDSLSKKMIQKNRKCKGELWPVIVSESDTFTDSISVLDVTASVGSHCQKGLFHLRGNVAELTSQDGVAMGGGWIHDREFILSQDSILVDGPNRFTGFRCVFEWRKVEDLKKELGIK